MAVLLPSWIACIAHRDRRTGIGTGGVLGLTGIIIVNAHGEGETMRMR